MHSLNTILKEHFQHVLAQVYHLQGGKMPVLTTNYLWQAVIDKVLQSVAALLLTLIKNKRYNSKDF